MGKEQNPDLQMKIATANNQVFVAKAHEPGSNEHAVALIKFAHLVANHPDGLTVARNLNRPNKK